MNILQKHSMFFHLLSFSFMFFHLLVMFFHLLVIFLSSSCHLLVIFLSSSCHLLVIFLSCSCHVLVMFLSCSCHVLVMFLSCSCHVLVMFLSFLLCSKSSLFLPRLPHVFLLKVLCKKIIFWTVLGGGIPLGPLFFSCLFFHFVHFRLLFNFFTCFAFFLCFSFYSFIFLLFSFLMNVSSSFILFLFFLFSGAQNLWQHFRIPWGRVHILSWLYLLCIGSSSLFHVE